MDRLFAIVNGNTTMDDFDENVDDDEIILAPTCNMDGEEYEEEGRVVNVPPCTS